MLPVATVFYDYEDHRRATRAPLFPGAGLVVTFDFDGTEGSGTPAGLKCY